MDSYQVGQLTNLRISTEVLLKTLLTEKKVSNSSNKTIIYYRGELGLFIKWLKQQGVFNIENITTQFYAKIA